MQLTLQRQDQAHEDAGGHTPVIPTDQLSSVIRVLPWNNGITLSQGHMSERLLDWWESEATPGVVEGIDSSLIIVSTPYFYNLVMMLTRAV